MKSNRIDTNIVSIKFGILADAKQVHTGDPVVCGNSECTAVLNSYSVVDEGEKVIRGIGRSCKHADFIMLRTGVEV